MIKDNDINKLDNLLYDLQQLHSNNFSKLILTLQDKQLLGIVNSYNEHKEEHTNPNFNIFSIISDKYYRENLHSDIIALFLNQNEKHQEGNKFLNLFIQFLKKLRPDLEITMEDFKNAIVTREKFRIDILIQDNKSGKAIIIENKINNASDTYRQLPTYVNAIKKENIVAIVYLPLDGNKKPNKDSWTKDEVDYIDSKLIFIPAYNRTPDDLFNGWLKPSIMEANEECKFILSHYSKIIQKIGGYIMDKYLFQNFYNSFAIDPVRYNTILSLRATLEEFPNYLAARIVDRFIYEGSPFQKVYNSNSKVVTLEKIEVQQKLFILKINCEIDKYEFKFWDSNYPVNHLKFTEKVIQHLGYNSFFKDYGRDELVRVFKFPDQEQQLYDFTLEFKNKVDSIADNIFFEN